MRVVVIEPASPIVTIEEARRHLMDLPEEDEPLVEMFIEAACAWVDGPAGWLGRAIGVQVLEWQGSGWLCRGEGLPFPPELEIISIKYVDGNGDQQEWPIPDPLYFSNLPAVRGQPGDVKIRYRAGYGTKDPQDPTKWNSSAPAPIKVAVLMLVAQWYRKRESVSIGAAVDQVPFGVEALLGPYRVFK